MLLKFPDCFDVDIAYQLRERDADTLEKMQQNVVGVDINILAKNARLRNERRVTIKEEASHLDGKFDFITKALEKVVERLDQIERKPQ